MGKQRSHEGHGSSWVRRGCRTFIDKIDHGTYTFANTGTYAFTSDDGTFTTTLTGDGKTKVASVTDAAAMLCNLYVVGPAMTHEVDVDFTPYIPADAAKLRFTHAEIIVPFASILGLRDAFVPVPKADTFTYANNPWRGELVSPFAANVQWDVYGDKHGALVVRMLYNEKEADFKPDCDGARRSPHSHYYDYVKLKACYGQLCGPDDARAP